MVIRAVAQVREDVLSLVNGAWPIQGTLSPPMCVSVGAAAIEIAITWQPMRLSASRPREPVTGRAGSRSRKRLAHEGELGVASAASSALIESTRARNASMRRGTASGARCVWRSRGDHRRCEFGGAGSSQSPGGGPIALRRTCRRHGDARCRASCTASFTGIDDLLLLLDDQDFLEPFRQRRTPSGSSGDGIVIRRRAGRSRRRRLLGDAEIDQRGGRRRQLLPEVAIRSRGLA